MLGEMVAGPDAALLLVFLFCKLSVFVCVYVCVGGSSGDEE